jgi:hypothetical protein
MNYQEYIDLGFTRTDMNDSVEFKQTGYYGFCLSKQVSEKLSISVSGGELDKPKLYIKKRSSDTYHIIQLSSEMVKDLLVINSAADYMHTAC